MILSFLFYFFLCYLLYRLIFNFIVPIYRTTKKVRRGFKDMQEKMNQQQNAPDAANNMAEDKKPNLDNVGEYIDFEDVK